LIEFREIFPSEYHISDGKGGVITLSIEPVMNDCSFTARQAVVTFSRAVRRKLSRLTSRPLCTHKPKHSTFILPQLNAQPFI